MCKTIMSKYFRLLMTSAIDRLDLNLKHIILMFDFWLLKLVIEESLLVFWFRRKMEIFRSVVMVDTCQSSSVFTIWCALNKLFCFPIHFCHLYYYYLFHNGNINFYLDYLTSNWLLILFNIDKKLFFLIQIIINHFWLFSKACLYILLH